MKMTKQILLITPILFLFWTSGCSKNLLHPGDTEPFQSEVDTSHSLHEKPGPGPNLGSAEKGMPGGGGISSDPEPDSEFFREENVGETETSSFLYEKPGSGPNFGFAEKGMPGDGSTGSFSAEPFIEESGMVAQLPKEEEIRRRLTYGSSESLKDIHFEFDRYHLDDQSLAILQKNAAYLKAHPNSRIEIQGHCDERGSNNYNITLGERRTQTAKSYLVSLGIDESRIHTISYGEERPFCFESNEKCWYQNRRGHFLVAE